MAAKLFEVGDVLPATTQLRISWDYDTVIDTNSAYIKTSNLDVGSAPFYMSVNASVGVYSTSIRWDGIYRELDNKGKTGSIIINTSSSSDSDRTVTAVFTEGVIVTWEDLNAPSGYTITFEENGGSEQTDLTEQTALPNPLPIPTKSGYTFLGWYYDSDFTNEAFADDPLTGDVTLYAKWGLTSGPKVFAVGDVLPATTRLRVYWDSTFVSQITGIPKYILGNDFNGSSYYQPIFGVMIEDDDGILSGEIWLGVRSSLSFSFFALIYNDGWQTPYTAEGGGHNYVDIDISAIPIEGRTIKVVDITGMSWEDLNASSGYTITFESNSGTTIPDIEEATELPTLPIPTKSGYTFVAWYYESDFQTRAKAGDTIEEDTTLYAKWHNLGSLFTEIADAIRSKDGTSENIRDVDFGERVKQIQGAIELTQAQYDALETKDANTYYLIVEE